MISHRRELCEALRLDLGRGHYASWFYELTLVETELQHALANLSTWIKPVKVDTPILIGPADS